MSGLACENKVELKSYEIYDPIRGQWTLIEDEGGLRKKRWGAAALAFRDEDLLVIGGRGKWASNTVEVLCGCAWRLAKQGLQGHDKRYTACLVTRPSDRWTCPQ